MLSRLQVTMCSEDGDMKSGARNHPTDSGTFPHPHLSRSPVMSMSHSNAQEEHLCPTGFQKNLPSTNTERRRVDGFFFGWERHRQDLSTLTGKMRSPGLRGLPW